MRRGLAEKVRSSLPHRRRVRSGLRRHGLVRRPAAIRALVEGRVLRFTEGNRIELFDDGRAGLAAMLDAIRNARLRIHLETYILRSDPTGRAFLDALAQRARAGVDVCLLYDGIGSRALDPRALQPVVAAGGFVLEFNPLRRGLLSRTLRRRDHRKLLLVDGEIAFLGGLNIGDEYSAERSGVPDWRDAHARLAGPVVRDLQAVFLESWFRADGPELPWPNVLADATDRHLPGSTRCAVLADGPAYRRRRMREVVISAIEEAEARVLVVSPYLVPGRRVLDALADAARRGIEVQLVTAGRTDHPLLRRAARCVLPRLLARGVRVFEDRDRMMHAKLAAFDDSLAILGTSNLDRQSLDHSYEVNLVVEDSEVARWIHERFGQAAAGISAVDSESLARGGLASRIVDRLAAWIVKLL
jgi:cardiolipin synthase